MANRMALHINKLEEFKEYLALKGWTIQETKGTWEVLRATKRKRKTPLLIYCKYEAKEHLSVCDRDMIIIRNFIAYSKEEIK